MLVWAEKDAKAPKLDNKAKSEKNVTMLKTLKIYQKGSRKLKKKVKS